MTNFNVDYPANHKARLQQSKPYGNLLQNLYAETVQYYEEIDSIQLLKSELNSLQNPTPDKIITLSEEIISFQTIENLLNYEVQKYSTFPLYNSPIMALNTGAVKGWTLLNHPLLLVTLLVFDANEFRVAKANGKVTSVINFQAGDISMRVLESEGFRCSHWQAPLIIDETPIQPDLMCNKLSDITYKTGDRIFTRGGNETVVYEDVETTTVILQSFCRVFRTNVMVDYAPVSHKFLSVAAADQRSSRVQILSTLMRLFGRHDALPELEKMLGHPDHFVRWQVAREMLSMAPEETLPSIKHLATNDANPSVRHNAQKTISILVVRGIG